MWCVRVRVRACIQEEQRSERRKMNVLVLIMHHLVTHGYIDSAERLQTECGVSFAKYDVADNIDLATILQV